MNTSWVNALWLDYNSWRLTPKVVTLTAIQANFEGRETLNKMSEIKTIEEFLHEIDEDIVKYAAEFRRNGFSSNRSMRCWRESDFDIIDVPIPEGHKRMIMKPVMNINRSPERFSKWKYAPTIGESPETKTHCVEYDACRKDVRRRCNLHDEIAKSINRLVGGESSEEDECSIIDVLDNQLRETNLLSPVERYIKNKGSRSSK